MRLSTAQNDRAAGVLLATAAGDALGVPYEFAKPPAPGVEAAMTGGGLGDFAPGEWSDDTSMAVAIARVAATGADLTTESALDQIGEGFLEWYDGGPADVGIQTSAVLSATRARLRAGQRGVSEVMVEEAALYTASRAHSAGNGALMRTAPVALAHLDDRNALALAARSVARLTHGDPLAGDSCVLWCEAIRAAVLEGRFDILGGLDLLPESRREQWRARLDDALDIERNRAERVPGARFRPNGFTVTALQAAVAAIVTTEVPARMPCRHLQLALHAAVRIGDDTDTVAAIAGGLLGARWGMSAVPAAWRRPLHGWPGSRGRDLERLAYLTANGGKSGKYGWPQVDRIDYAHLQYGRPAIAVHPYDDGVHIAGATALDDLPEGIDAVVSLCLTGRTQIDEQLEHLNFRIMDEADPEQNPNLDFALLDAARVIAALREEGKTVLLHCVAAHSRTPTVAIVYAMLRGVPLDEAVRTVCAALPAARPNPGFHKALKRLADMGVRA